MGQGSAFLTSLLSTFPGEGGRWALCSIFTISLLFTLQDRNNRKIVNSWTLPPGNTSRQLWHGFVLIKRSRGPHIFHAWGKGPTAHAQKGSLRVKRESVTPNRRWMLRTSFIWMPRTSFTWLWTGSHLGRNAAREF